MGNKEHRYTKKEIINKLDACLNKTLGEIDINNVFEKTKANPKITGIAGDVIEQSVLGYPADNRQAPDLNIDGVETELKTTGIRQSKTEKGKYEAKEPMSITAVSPDSIVDEEFENSNFWHKLDHLLFVYYLYASSITVKAADYANFPIKGYEFYEFSTTDLQILKNDWLLVKNFIKKLQEDFDDYKAQYPRLSSELRKNLLYIDTAPKWPHPPRFRLKRAVITNIVQAHFGERLEQLPIQYNSYADIDSKCHELTERFSGKTVRELIDYFEITGNVINKSISERIIVKMFGGNVTKMRDIELFDKIGLISKSIVLTTEGLRTEDMKLFRMDFGEICNPGIGFEDSSFKDYFLDGQMLCIVFEEPSLNSAFEENKFIGFKRINFSDDFIEKKVEPVWNKIRQLIFNRKLVDVVVRNRETNKLVFNRTGVVQSAPNFPKSKDNIVFVRGSSADSKLKPLCINGIHMYNQYLWLKGSYIATLLSTKDYL